MHFSAQTNPAMLLLCWHNCEHLTLQSNVDDTYAFDLRPLPCLRLQPPWNMLCGSTDCMGPHMFTPGSSESLISFYILRGQVKIPLIREFWKVIRWSMCAGSQTQSSYNKFWHRVLKGIVTELIDVHVYHISLMLAECTGPHMYPPGFSIKLFHYWRGKQNTLMVFVYMGLAASLAWVTGTPPSSKHLLCNIISAGRKAVGLFLEQSGPVLLLQTQDEVRHAELV